MLRFRLALASAVLAVALTPQEALASIGDDIEAASDLAGRINRQLDTELFCTGTDVAALDSWAAEIADLRPVMEKWETKKGSSARWGDPTREALAGLERSASLLASAKRDFDACLDWADVSSAWDGAMTPEDLVKLATSPGSRTKQVPYELARFGGAASRVCAERLTSYLAETEEGFLGAPLPDPRGELDRLAKLTECAAKAGGVPGAAARRDLINADLALQAAIAETVPGEIATKLTAALTAMPDEMEGSRSALIETALAHLRAAVDEAIAGSAKTPPTPESILSMLRFKQKVAAVPHESAEAMALQLDQRIKALQAQWDKIETAAASAPGLKYDPSTKVLEAAIAYAKKNRSASIDSFRREWFRRVGVHENTVEFMVATPFFNVAVNALSKARSYEDLSLSAAKRYADEFRNKFAFIANFVVTSSSQARDYKTLVKVGDTVVKPVKEDHDTCSRVEAGLLCSITGYFPMEQIPADSKVTLVLLRGSFGREVTTTFDLKQLR